MADKKKAAKDDGAKGFRLPKSIAGAKLPKEARRKLSDLAKHPIVADILAAGLVALAVKLKNNPKVKKAVADAGDAAKDAGAQVAEATTVIAKPVVKRVRKPSSTTATPRRSAAKPAAAAITAAKPARKAKAAETAPAKPRASRRATPKAPKPPKAPAKPE
ncbi:hypothetical protein ACMGDH_10005 [Sphingomonas sp. DT-207]|uniref:hypothetical protein n=1 Tax=Sphingomonas sp. DT-207 TaxID=3396167 RepID=UPI003F196E3E